MGRGAAGACLVVLLVVVAAGCTVPRTTQQFGKTPSATTASESPAATPSPSNLPQPTPLTIAGLAFHGGEVGISYGAVAVGAVGGVPPYHWTISVGALPAGLTLSSDGMVAGTPTAAGAADFGVQVFDSSGNTAGVGGSINIVAAMTANFLRECVNSSTCSAEQGCVTVCGGFGYQGGGEPPYTYSITAGGTPPGTSLYGLSLAGTFTAVGTFRFQATVTDGYGATAAITPTFYVYPHIAFSVSSTVCTGAGSTGCKAQMTYTGGGGTPSVQITGVNVKGGPPGATGPPDGFSATAAGGVVGVSVPGPNTSYSNYGYDATLTLVLVDQSPCGSGANCSSGSATLDIRIAAG